MDNQVTHSRRRLIGVGLGGAAVSLLPFLSDRAQASSGSTTTAPPERPTEADTELLLAALQMELAIRDLYDEALAGVDWGDEDKIVLADFREAHEEYANTFSGMLGSGSQRSGSVFEEFVGRLVAGRDEALRGAWALEAGAVAAYQQILESLQGLQGVINVAAIQIAEARHSTILADLAGSDDMAELLVEQEQDALEVVA